MHPAWCLCMQQTGTAYQSQNYTPFNELQRSTISFTLPMRRSNAKLSGCQIAVFVSHDRTMLAALHAGKSIYT
jgi:hypothetical protein